MRTPLRCANLAPESQDRRLRLGIVLFTGTVVLAVVLARVHAHWAARWALVVPFFGATMAVSQAMYRTCPMLAARGMREGSGGGEPIADPEERRRIRGNGRRLLLASALIALTAAGLFAQLSPV